MPPAQTFHIEPIGTIHSPFRERADAPRQPRAGVEVEGTVELFSGRGHEDALCDLACWDHVWLIFWFDRNDHGYTPKVTPPRSDRKRGVFATRAPYRPNPIGISAVRLLSVSGLTLHVSGLDILDGTPLLDLKPYVPYTDSIPGANHGWLERESAARAAPSDPGARFTVRFGPEAEAQLAWLRETHGIELAARIEAQLSLGPTPHAYRRIRRDGDKLRLAMKDWRAWFRVDGASVLVERIGSGYKPSELARAPAVHAAFTSRFPVP